MGKRSGLEPFAEYACAGADLLALKPANATFEESAAVPLAAITALQGLPKGQIRPGQRVLVNGASGGVGSFAVQIAKSFGTEVTAVCSRQNLDNARSMGADHVIDYTQEDFTRNRLRYDLILAVNGHHPILGYRRTLNSTGICVVLGGSVAQIVQSLLFGPLISRTGSRKIGFMGIAKPNQKDLLLIKDLLEAGSIKPMIDRLYPLSDTAEAILALEEGHARGKLAIAG
jgi:NADPH:quinone reductase-like Zn-dependent oxidoreductase